MVLYITFIGKGNGWVSPLDWFFMLGFCIEIISLHLEITEESGWSSKN
jgi:hypothetical protein